MFASLQFQLVWISDQRRCFWRSSWAPVVVRALWQRSEEFSRPIQIQASAGPWARNRLRRRTILRIDRGRARSSPGRRRAGVAATRPADSGTESSWRGFMTWSRVLSLSARWSAARLRRRRRRDAMWQPHARTPATPQFDPSPSLTEFSTPLGSN